MRILLIEPDRLYARLIKRKFEATATLDLATSADSAIALADKNKPDLVICELSLPSHSASEFIYEFRTYPDWYDIPIIIHSTMHIDPEITKSKDWRILNISEIFYKPDCTLEMLYQSANELVSV